MKKLLLLALAFLLAACSAAGGSELSRNRDKWEQSGITRYRFDLFIGCFCPFADKMPLTLEVRDGELVSMTYPDGTAVEETDPNYGFFAEYATIDRIFAELEAFEGGEADEVMVTYDPTHGFPQQASVDRIKEAIDDELGLQISNFELMQ